MPEPEQATRVVRFGVFEVDLQTAELRKQGARIRLPGQSFQVLEALLLRPGELVTRDELRQKLWPSDTFGDFEHGLNAAVNRVREALGDSSDNPRFVETLPRRGYRFIAPVSGEPRSADELRADLKPLTRDTGSNSPAAAVSLEPEAPAQEASQPGSNRRLRRWLPLGAAILVVAAAAGVWYLHRPLPPPRISGYTQLTHDGHNRWLTGVDASRIYINSFAGGAIYQVGIDGGEMVPVPVAVPGALPMGADVLPDGSSLLVISNEKGKPAGTLWNVRIPDGSYRRLGYALDAAFSPDKGNVVYTTLEGDVWLVRSDGTEGQKLGPAGGKAYWLAWSPDGHVIRFNRGGRLWEISSNGSSLHEVLPGWHGSDDICCGHWTPDGKLYTFLAGDEIWAIDERRGLPRQAPSEPVRLTTGPILWDSPFPSTDGKKIFAYGATLRGELSRVDPATKALNPFLGGISADNVSFSKDGQYVAYVSYPEGILWRANRDGSKPLQLTDPPMKAHGPRWSPDGLQILFTDGSSGRYIAFTVPSEGGIPKRILPEENGSQEDPNWSADGSKIVVGLGDFRDPKSFLSILNIASRQVTQVPGSVGIWSPRWSPDGRFIAALTGNSGTILKVFDIEVQRWSELQIEGAVGWFAFSRDSRYIYFVQSDPSDPEILRILRIPVKGGAAEFVADLKDWRFTGAVGGWMNLDPTDAPLLMRDAGSKDIYALTLEEK
jgi:DNA-binding winged helix-turn-helix (wHTH) protein/Tol biopolymer transport system component